MKLNSLEELFLQQLRDLYSAENQLVKALPKMAQAANYPELRSAFEEHLDETRNQVQRLQTIFERLGKKASGEKCKGMEGLIEEGEEMIKMDAEPAAKDAGLIAAAQRVEHYEIAGYGTVRAYAEILGHREAVDLLQETLDEEKEIDEQLTGLAESLINVDAVRAAGGQARARESE
jgi:ferritin-like metal-binding protein YciE